MFERYTEKARRVIFFARFEASRFGSPAIDTEHLLIGLAREDGPMLERFTGRGLSMDEAEKIVELVRPRGESYSTSVDVPLTEASKRVLNSAMEESNALGHKSIGTVHLLLGLLREEEGAAASILREFGADAEQIRGKLREEGEPKPEKHTGGLRTGEVVEGLRGKLARGLELAAGVPRAGFERYNERARRAIFFARYEATQFGSQSIETEHLLLGVLRELERDRFRFLPVAISFEAAREEIRRRATAYKTDLSRADLPLSLESRRVLAHAADEAQAMHVDRIGPGHLLLGMMREENSLAAKILQSGADPEQIRKAARKQEEDGKEPEDPDWTRGDFGDYT